VNKELCGVVTVQPNSVLYLCLSDYVRLLNLTGQMKTARRHSVVDMQFEFRIEALGNDVHINVFAHLVILILRILWVAYSFFFCCIFLLNVCFLLDISQSST